MAAEGWLLTGYHEKILEFEQTEPQKLHFAVSFFPDYVAGVSQPPEKLEKLWEFAQMDGWQHITGNYHTQVFFNTAENPVPLHTDATVQLENYDSIIKKQYLKKWKICAGLSAAAYLVFAVLLLVNLIPYISTQHMTFPLYALLSVRQTFLPYTLGEFIYNIVKIVRYKKWLKKSAQSAKDANAFIPLTANNFSDKINVVVSAVIIISLFIQIFSFVRMSAFMSSAIEAVFNQ